MWRVLRKAETQRGATSVEYAIMAVLIILVIIATVLWLVNPADEWNSVMPQTFNAVGSKVGNFGTVDLPAN